MTLRHSTVYEIIKRSFLYITVVLVFVPVLRASVHFHINNNLSQIDIYAKIHIVKELIKTYEHTKYIILVLGFFCLFLCVCTMFRVNP